jgi:hypothetical protein
LVGARTFKPNSSMTFPTRSSDFTQLNTEVAGCMGNCAQTAERIPVIPLRIAICSDTEPTQWPNAWTSFWPVSLMTFLTASGQSFSAMSSIVNGFRAEGRSIPAR